MRIKIRRPDDFHVHFRDEEMLRAVARYTSRVFNRALIMPNVPAVTSAAILNRYRERIIHAAGPGFTPLMTLKLTPQTTPQEIEEAAAVGAVAVKIYPEGVTTGSEDGLSLALLQDFAWLGPRVEAMISTNLILCWHGQVPGDDDYSFCLDAERDMLPTIRAVVDEFPGLRHVVEHISTAEAVRWVLLQPDRVAATITVHHLMLTLGDVLGRGQFGGGGKLHPHYFCAPVFQRPGDRDRLIWAATSGNPKFFLGTDSAPHLREYKENACGCAGIFTAPVALPALASVFDGRDAICRLEAFCSEFGARFYGLPLNDGYLELSREPWTIQERPLSNRLETFLSGKVLDWRVG